MKINFLNGRMDHINIGGNNPLCNEYPTDGDFRLWLVYTHFRHPFLVGQTLCGIGYDKDFHSELNTLKSVNCPWCIHMFNVVVKSKI